jgi:hypothetical protein
MAALLEPLGGGGHPYVGGCSFAADQEDHALAVQRSPSSSAAASPAPAPPPRMTRDELAGTLVQLRRRVDAHFDAAVARSPAAFACGPGCAPAATPASACSPSRPPRSAALAASPPPTPPCAPASAPGRRPRPRRSLRPPGRRPLRVYGERPLICRSHGLPVRPTARVDHCPLNFTRPSPAASQRPAAGRREPAPGGDRHPLARRDLQTTQPAPGSTSPLWPAPPMTAPPTESALAAHRAQTANHHARNRARKRLTALRGE